MDEPPRIRLATIKLTNRFYPGDTFSKNICKQCVKKFGACPGDPDKCKLATGRKAIPRKFLRDWMNQAFPEHKKTARSRKK